MAEPPVQPVYLGDGVYASFDGMHIWLHLDSHPSPGIIALEPDVFAQLEKFAKRVYRA